MSLVPIKVIKKKKHPTIYVRADVPITVTIQHIVIWDVNHVVLVNTYCFRGICYIHIQGRKMEAAVSSKRWYL